MGVACSSSSAPGLGQTPSLWMGHSVLFTSYNEGYGMVPFNLKVFAKFGLCSNCSQKFHGCSLARARKILASARMLGFSLKCA